jgi:hypothetical protein
MGDVDPAFKQQFLHVAVAQQEAVIEPDPMANDLPGEAVVCVAFGGQRVASYRLLLLKLAWSVRGYRGGHYVTGWERWSTT